MNLQGKVALVTGAGGRLGRAVTNKLLAEGAALVLVDQDVSELSKMSVSPDWIAPDALADVIALLCSPAARAIHGAGLQIAGRVWPAHPHTPLHPPKHTAIPIAAEERIHATSRHR